MSRVERLSLRTARLILGSEGTRRARLVDKVVNSKSAKKATFYMVPMLAFTRLADSGILAAQGNDQDKKAEDAAR